MSYGEDGMMILTNFNELDDLSKQKLDLWWGWDYDKRPLPGAPQPKEQIGDEDEEFWKSKAEAELEKALSMTPNTGVAKNIIIFIGG